MIKTKKQKQNIMKLKQKRFVKVNLEIKYQLTTKSKTHLKDLPLKILKLQQTEIKAKENF